MRHIQFFPPLMMAAALAFSCDNGGNSSEKTEPQAPVIESASLKGAGGESSISPGQKAVFTAKVSVEGSTLSSYTVEIRRDSGLLGTAEASLSGSYAEISNEFDLPVDEASVSADFYPAVTLKVINADNLFTERLLSDEENVLIKAPEAIEELYLIDSNGKVFDMQKTSAGGQFRTSGDISGIGTSFTIASRLNGSAADPSGKIWSDIPTPDSGGYGLVWIGFNIYTEETSKMVNHTEAIDFSAMADDAATDNSGKAYKVFWARSFVQDCKVEFLNFPDGIKVQGDRFADVEGNTARWTGQTTSGAIMEVYYIQDARWLTVKYQWNVTDAVWLTGENASVPMDPYCESYPLNWFANSPNGLACHTTISAVKTDSSEWRALVYLKENFAFKCYSYFGWAYEISPLTSGTPDTLAISPIEEVNGTVDGNYCNAGTSFSEGLYMFRLNTATYVASLDRYNGEEPVINASR